eukprot:363628-Chlamydomonas_euryale.AAC.4
MKRCEHGKRCTQGKVERHCPGRSIPSYRGWVPREQSERCRVLDAVVWGRDGCRRAVACVHACMRRRRVSWGTDISLAAYTLARVTRRRLCLPPRRLSPWRARRHEFLVAAVHLRAAARVDPGGAADCATAAGGVRCAGPPARAAA